MHFVKVEGESTRERIIGAAECLLAEHGFESVSLRDITNAAEVNVAAVNYHFGSKEKLFEEVQCRYIKPVNEERLRMLGVYQSGGRVAGLREVLEAFMRPFFSMVTRSEMNERLFFKLMGRCITDQDGTLPESVMPQFQQVVREFTGALHQAVPGLSIGTMMWRLHYTFGLMAHSVLHGDVLRKLSGGQCGDPDVETRLQGMLEFCEAGFLAKEGEEV